MRALSIKQPWAWLIANGHKDIENRSWKTTFRGPVLIHSGKMYDGDMLGVQKINGVVIPPIVFRFPGREIEMGGIIGMADIVDCVQQSGSVWHNSGSWGFVIKNARPLPFMPCRGQLGFFEVDYKGEIWQKK
jgi:hypothetical protein